MFDDSFVILNRYFNTYYLLRQCIRSNQIILLSLIGKFLLGDTLSRCVFSLVVKDHFHKLELIKNDFIDVDVSLVWFVPTNENFRRRLKFKR